MKRLSREPCAFSNPILGLHHQESPTAPPLPPGFMVGQNIHAHPGETPQTTTGTAMRRRKHPTNTTTRHTFKQHPHETTNPKESPHLAGRRRSFQRRRQEVVEKALRLSHVALGDAEVQARGVLEGVQAPAPVAHAVALSEF